MVDAPEGGKRKIADPWQPLTTSATLALDWPIPERDGAALDVDGQSIAIVSDQPLVVPLSPGTHTVHITRPGCLPLEKSVSLAIDQQQNLSIALQPAATALVVRWPSSEHANAELRIDGEVRQIPNGSNGDTVTLPLKPGAHELFIFRPGFRPFSQSVNVAAAEQTTITPSWNPLPQMPAETVANGKDVRAAVSAKPNASESAIAPIHRPSSTLFHLWRTNNAFPSSLTNFTNRPATPQRI